MASATILTRTYPVGSYRVTFSRGPAEPGTVSYSVAEWEPDVPPPKSLTAAEVEQYRAARADFWAEFEKLTGQRVAVVDAFGAGDMEI